MWPLRNTKWTIPHFLYLYVCLGKSIRMKVKGSFLNFYSFSFQSLSQEIIRRTQQTRTSVKDDCLKKSAADKSNASMQKAQDLAKNILNLSQSDLDEIMSADGDSTKVVRFPTLKVPITTNAVC